VALLVVIFCALRGIGKLFREKQYGSSTRQRREGLLEAGRKGVALKKRQ
jgi:hypothetical protein